MFVFTIFASNGKRQVNFLIYNLTFASEADIKPRECLGVPITRAKYFLRIALWVPVTSLRHRSSAQLEFPLKIKPKPKFQYLLPWTTFIWMYQGSLLTLNNAPEVFSRKREWRTAVLLWVLPRTRTPLLSLSSLWTCIEKIVVIEGSPVSMVALLKQIALNHWLCLQLILVLNIHCHGTKCTAQCTKKLMRMYQLDSRTVFPSLEMQVKK